MSQHAIIPCIGGAFLSYYEPDTNHSSSTKVPTCYRFAYNVTDKSSIENYRNIDYANKYDSSQGSKHYDAGGALLEFDDENGIFSGYKSITDLKLYSKIALEFGSQTPADEQFLTLSSIWLVAYKSNQATNQITFDNYDQNATIKGVGGGWAGTSQSEISFNINISDLEDNIFYSQPVRYILMAGYNIIGTETATALSTAKKIEIGNANNYIEKNVIIADTYLDVYYEDIPIQTPTPLNPIDTGFGQYQPITFSWQYNTATPATQTGATIQYRERGGSTWTTVTVSGSGTSYTLQAGLTTGQYEWHVCVENSLGETSSYCSVKYFQIVAQSAPTPVSPGDNITLFEGHAITFTWIYNSLTPATQASATIKYRVRGGSTWTTYTSTSSNPYCTISDIPQGQYEWCLNITNNYGETSADSGTLEFNIIGRPQKPIILEPDNCCLTTISWNAEGQEAAEFILMDGDDNILIHETVATAVTSYKPQMFLKGSYKAMARIKNNSDLWSDYGELEFDIDAAEPDPGNLIAMPFDTEIHLEGTYTSTNVAIVRIDEDETETVLAMDDHAVDKKVAGGTEYAYVLRSWNTGGYIDTPAKVFDFKFEGAIFSTETEELHLDRSEQKFLAHNEEIERQYAQMRYVGREFAVIERGEYTEQTLSKQFHVTKAQRRILDRMAKEKSLFYRDSRGNAFKAAILGVSYNEYMDDAYIASIKLTRTAADEVIINV